MRSLTLFMCLAIQGRMAFASISLEPSTSKTLAAADLVKWGISLLLVLTLFLMCVWLVRKAGGLTSATASQMRVLGALSLGAKERVVLLQVGHKQLLLGVSPGCIETLHVLEGEDCLLLDDAQPSNTGSKVFAEKLMQVMKVHGND